MRLISRFSTSLLSLTLLSGCGALDSLTDQYTYPDIATQTTTLVSAFNHKLPNYLQYSQLACGPSTTTPVVWNSGDIPELYKPCTQSTLVANPDQPATTPAEQMTYRYAPNNSQISTRVRAVTNMTVGTGSGQQTSMSSADRLLVSGVIATEINTYKPKLPSFAFQQILQKRVDVDIFGGFFGEYRCDAQVRVNVSLPALTLNEAGFAWALDPEDPLATPARQARVGLRTHIGSSQRHTVAGTVRVNLVNCMVGYLSVNSPISVYTVGMSFRFDRFSVESTLYPRAVVNGVAGVGAGVTSGRIEVDTVPDIALGNPYLQVNLTGISSSVDRLIVDSILQQVGLSQSRVGAMVESELQNKIAAPIEAGFGDQLKTIFQDAVLREGQMICSDLTSASIAGVVQPPAFLVDYTNAPAQFRCVTLGS